MNRNRMLILAIVALMLSGGVTYLAYRVLQTRLRPPDITTQIVVASKKLPMGVRITKEDVQAVQWPKATPLEGSFNDPSQVDGRATLAPLQVNEPILESKLAPKEGGAGLTAIIPEGMRAVTIQVNSIIGVAGFVLPGSRVDLVLTAIPPKGAKNAKPDEMASKIVLENLQVIAAGQNVQTNVDGKPQMVQDVTLLVTPEQAERVALATTDGRIQLALRNAMDKDAMEPILISRTALYAGPTVEENPKTPATEKGLESVKGAAASKVAVSAKTAGAGKASATAKSEASTKTVAVRKKVAPAKALVEAPPPPPKPRIVTVELIQGAKRTNESFEEKKP